MRIGRLRARLRKTSVEPEYYSDYASFKAFGENLKVEILPYDGKAFLYRYWYLQNNKVWYGRSINGMIPTASIGYPLKGRKETKKNKKDWFYLTFLSYPCDNIIVNYTLNLEGAWIEWSGDAQRIEGFWIEWSGDAQRITVLETTRVKVEFRAETCEVLLPPGAAILLNPLTLMQRLRENISVRKRRRIPTQVMEVFASAKTPQELAARLELEPIRLREELEDKGEVMRRLVDY